MSTFTIAKWWRDAGRSAAISIFAAAAICGASPFAFLEPALGVEMKSDSSKTILQDLSRLRQHGSVLYIAAHPDDENTELLAYLARGRHYRTAYLSLTRGDGGQNVLGPDLGEKLGVARTQELLAARQIDGARQYFSRAVDYGFSKNYLETLNVWDKNEVLSDIVRVIRQFKPDVIITRFSPSPGGTHGHHTTSTVLAIEAFKMAGDPKAFPEQKLAPWHAKRLLWNVSQWQKEKIASEPILKIETTGTDAQTGETFHDIASASRAMHKTQGFDQFKLPGGNGEQRFEQFQLLGGEPATTDIMDGVETTWAKTAEVDAIIKSFDAANPAASVPALLELRKALKDGDRERLELLDRIIVECLGLNVRTTIAAASVVPGEKLTLHTVASVERDFPVKLVRLSFPAAQHDVARDDALAPGKGVSIDTEQTLPPSVGLTQPYWLRKEGTAGMFHVDDPSLIGTPENEPPFPVEATFEVGGQSIVVRGEPLAVTTDAVGNETRRRMQVIPPVSLRFTNDVAIMTPGASKSVEVEVKAARADSIGTVHLEAPPGWSVKPGQQNFSLSTVGQTALVTFTVSAPKAASNVKFIAVADIAGARYLSQYQEISYHHLPLQVLQPPAVLKAVSVDLQKRGQVIGYLPGAGDSIPENLQQMGYAVKMLDDANLTAADLSGIDAVVLGVRAFNVRENIGKAMPALLNYVENGGTVVVQYNRPDKLKSAQIAPFPLTISADRVTDETAPMTFLAPDHPVLNTPNKLTSGDFDSWQQERGLYFPNKWDEHFTPILACNDAGETPSKGVLLVAQYGRGYYVYTGLSLFRQLPAGVPGAYRLFANMVSLGK